VPYEPGVFYCKDAFEGLGVMGALTDLEKRGALLAQLHTDAAREMGREVVTHTASQTDRSSVTPLPLSPAPFSLGARVVRAMPLELVFDCLSINELYRLSWGAKNTHGSEWEKLKAEFDIRLARMKRDAVRQGWLKPQGVYGYWPCQSDGNDLILYQPESVVSNHPDLLVRFSFPRQSFDDHLCLADYFAPVDSGVMDLVAFQVVTVGGGGGLFGSVLSPRPGSADGRGNG
jgi:5-methyltetrahydrofolate--homocysteine methyltransferase